MRRLLGAVCSVVMAVALVAFVPAQAQALAPQLVLVSPDKWPSVIDPTAGGSLSVRATNLGEGTGTLQLGGRAPQTVNNDEVVTFDLATLLPGNRELRLTLCDEIQGCRSTSRILVVRIAPSIEVWGNDRLLNENGDGLWESATPRIRLDPDVDVAVQWSVKSGSRLVAGPFPLTQQQIGVARAGMEGVGVPIHAQTLGKGLPAGDYSVEVRSTGVEEGFTKSAVRSWELHVSTAPAITALTPRTSVFYPRDVQTGVAHEMVLSPRLDPRVVRYGVGSFEVLDAKGQVLANLSLDPAEGIIRWTGMYHPETGGGHQLAPAGIYRIRLSAWDDGVETAQVSAPFRLSHAYRTMVEVVGPKRRAASTRTATLTTRAASVRAVGGSLIYRKHRGAEPPSGPLVQTVHKIRVPSSSIKNVHPLLRVHGRWAYDTDIDVRIVTPRGKVVEIISALADRRHRYVFIRPRWIRPDGTVKFHLRWRGWGSSGRVDSIAVSRHTYRWRT